MMPGAIGPVMLTVRPRQSPGGTTFQHGRLLGALGQLEHQSHLSAVTARTTGCQVEEVEHLEGRRPRIRLNPALAGEYDVPGCDGRHRASAAPATRTSRTPRRAAAERLRLDVFGRPPQPRHAPRCRVKAAEDRAHPLSSVTRRSVPAPACSSTWWPTYVVGQVAGGTRRTDRLPAGTWASAWKCRTSGAHGASGPHERRHSRDCDQSERGPQRPTDACHRAASIWPDDLQNRASGS